MPNPNPTNGELAVMLKGIEKIMELKAESDKEAHDGVHKRLDVLNGQVKKNTAFRNQALIIKGMLGSVGLAVIGLIADRIV